MQSCRICFVTDVRMVMLGDTKVKEFLENIFSAHGFTEKLNERHYVCYECKAMLTRSYNFIQKALRAQTAFKNLQHPKTTNDDAWKELRVTLGLNSTLSYYNVPINLSIEADDTDLLFEEDNDTKTGLIQLIDPVSTQHKDNTKCDREDKAQLHSIVINPSQYEGILRSNNKSGEKSEIKHEYFVEVACIKTEKFEDENYESVSNTEEMPEVITRKEKKVTSSRNRKPVLKKANQRIKLSKCNSFKDEEQSSSAVDLSTNKVQTKKPKRNTKKGSRLRNTNLKRKRRKKYKDYVSSDSNEDGYESYDDNGKRIKRPKEEVRVYPRKCEHCDYIIEAGKYHYYHYLNVHPKEEYPYMRKDRPYICQFCGICKKYLSELREHELIHGADKPFVCQECGKSFCNKKQLRAHHSRVHIAPRLFCEYCNKGFKEKSVLKLHIRTHTGEKPYKCQICGAGFAHGGNVGVHMRNVHQQDGNKTKSRSKDPQITSIPLMQSKKEPLNLLASKPSAHSKN